jgi:hypothetical protein
MNKLKVYRKCNILIIAILVTSISGCISDIETPVRDALTQDEFFSNGNDLVLAVNDLYRILPDIESLYLADATSDNLVTNGAVPEITGSRIVPTPRGSGGWDWSHLRSINWIINNAHKVDNIDVRNEYTGIARWFRAYFYFEKVKRFGDVPWYNKVIEVNDTTELYKARTPRTTVIDSILADLDYAINNIPAEKKLNRITKYTALALKSRVGLFEGTYQKYHSLGDYERYLKVAASSAKELINTEAYTIFAVGGPNESYRMLFARDNQDATETILANKYHETRKKSNYGGRLTKSTWGAFGVTKDVINSYLLADGNRFTDNPEFEKIGFYEEMQNRDSRLTQTTAGPYFTVLGESSPEPVDLQVTRSGYRFIKGLPPRSQWGDGTTYIDAIIFRFAEVLLNYAEAKAELGTLTQEDLNISINRLRDRVQMPHLEMTNANANPDPFLEKQYPNVDKGPNKGVILEIRRERRIELFAEGFRWNDLMRWREGKKVELPMVGIYFPDVGAYDFNNDGIDDVYIHMNDPSGSPGTVVEVINIAERKLLDPITGELGGTSGNIACMLDGSFDESRDYLYPIPSEDLELNPNLVQNPGW